MIRVWLARTPARLIGKVKTTHFFEAKVCPNGPKWTFSDGAGPGSRPKCQNDTLFWTKSVSILIEIKEIGSKTYSNSYKKLMVLRKSNRVEQNRGGNGRNSWNPMQMINPTHFSSQKVCRINENGWFPTPRGVEWSGSDWTEVDWAFCSLNNRLGSEPNWTDPNRTEARRSEVNRSEVKRSGTNWNELRRKRNEQNWSFNNTEVDSNSSGSYKELNWTWLNRTELNWSQMKWTDMIIYKLNWAWLNRTELTWNENEMNRNYNLPTVPELGWIELKPKCSGINWSLWPIPPKQFCHPWGGGPELQTPTTIFFSLPTSQLPPTFKGYKEIQNKGGRGFQRR